MNKILSNVIQEATSIAKTSNVIRGKIGAVLFKDNGHIIVKSSNSVLLGNKDHTIHAEQFLLLKALKIKAFSRFDNLNVLVVRWKKEDGSLGNAKPCIKCRKSLSSKALNVYYSNVDGDINFLKF